MRPLVEEVLPLLTPMPTQVDSSATEGAAVPSGTCQVPWTLLMPLPNCDSSTSVPPQLLLSKKVFFTGDPAPAFWAGVSRAGVGACGSPLGIVPALGTARQNSGARRFWARLSTRWTSCSWPDEVAAAFGRNPMSVAMASVTRAAVRPGGGTRAVMPGAPLKVTWLTPIVSVQPPVGAISVCPGGQGAAAGWASAAGQAAAGAGAAAA